VKTRPRTRTYTGLPVIFVCEVVLQHCGGGSEAFHLAPSAMAHRRAQPRRCCSRILHSRSCSQIYSLLLLLCASLPARESSLRRSKVISKVMLQLQELS